MGDNKAIKVPLNKFRPQFPCLFTFVGYDEYSRQSWLPCISLVSVESAIGAEIKGEKLGKFVLQYLLGIVAEVMSKLAYELL